MSILFNFCLSDVDAVIDDCICGVTISAVNVDIDDVVIFGIDAVITGVTFVSVYVDIDYVVIVGIDAVIYDVIYDVVIVNVVAIIDDVIVS